MYPIYLSFSPRVMVGLSRVVRVDYRTRLPSFLNIFSFEIILKKFFNFKQLGYLILAVLMRKF